MMSLQRFSHIYLTELFFLSPILLVFSAQKISLYLKYNFRKISMRYPICKALTLNFKGKIPDEMFYLFV